MEFTWWKSTATISQTKRIRVQSSPSTLSKKIKLTIYLTKLTHSLTKSTFTSEQDVCSFSPFVFLLCSQFLLQIGKKKKEHFHSLRLNLIHLSLFLLKGMCNPGSCHSDIGFTKDQIMEAIKINKVINVHLLYFKIPSSLFLSLSLSLFSWPFLSLHSIVYKSSYVITFLLI